MTDHDEIRQQLLELIYGLLPADQASRLASRIGSDPELARTYADVKEQTDLLASAIRVTEVPVPDFAAWKKEAQAQDRVERSRPLQGFVRSLQVLTALAASILILSSGAALFFTTTAELAHAPASAQVRDRAAPSSALKPAIELEVSGPRVLSSEVANRFAVSVRQEAASQEEAEISYNFKSPQGETIASGKQLAVNGMAKIALPADQARADLTLQVFAQQGRELVEVESPPLASAPPQTVTSLSLDRSLVRAGETIRWRSNTLSSQTQAPVDGAVAFEILDPNQQPISGYVDQGETQQGVAASTWSLPSDSLAGNYSLIAKNIDGVADVTRFQVDPLAPPIWNARLDFTRDWFRPGEAVSASLHLNSQSGQPLANQKLQMRQIVQGSFVAEPQEIETSATGEANVTLQLAAADPRASQHLYFSNADQSWAYASPIPLEPQAVDILFCPEGGTLVAGLSNRVYFHATDANGKPVELQGSIVNSRDEVVATAKTEYRGRGRFDFIPLPQQHYRLTAPLGESQVDADLPPISETARATIKVPDPVVDADQPLEVEVVSRDGDQRYGLAYYNNGVLVTQQFFAVPQTLKSTRVRLDVPPEIAGAGEVTLYAANASGQVLPLAERMVFRRPLQRLAIETPDLQTDYAANDHVNIQVVTKNEAGQPTASALGVAVVNETAFAHTIQASPTLVASQLLTKRLQRPEELKDPQALLSDDDQAESELDFILATDGWRQFIQADPNRGLGREPAVELAYGRRQAVPATELERIAELSPQDYSGIPAAAEASPPILILKNQISQPVAKSIVAASLPSSHPTGSRAADLAVELTPWLLGAAIVTTLGLLVLALLHAAGSPWFWGPAMVVSSLAVVALGVMLPLTSMAPHPASDQIALHEIPAIAPLAAPESETPGTSSAPIDGGRLESSDSAVEELQPERELLDLDAEADRMRSKRQASPPNAAMSPLSDSIGQPMAADSAPTEERKITAEKATERAEVVQSMAAPAEPATTPMSKGMSAENAGEKSPQMRIARDAVTAKKEANNAPAAPSSTPPSSLPDAASAANGAKLSAMGTAPQARYSLSDNKQKAALGELQSQSVQSSPPQRDEELLQRSQALGITEYGLRQAESQQASKQSGMAPQQAQSLQAAGGGVGGAAGFAPPQPAVEASPAPQPMQRMMARGAGQQDRASQNAVQPFAAANDKADDAAPQDFFYRAYAYGDAAPKDAGEGLSNQTAPETIYWAPLVQTDSNGQATLRFQLPPNPGKYRITIDALAAGRLGSVRHRFATLPASNSAAPPATKKADK